MRNVEWNVNSDIRGNEMTRALTARFQFIHDRSFNLMNIKERYDSFFCARVVNVFHLLHSWIIPNRRIRIDFPRDCVCGARVKKLFLRFAIWEEMRTHQREINIHWDSYAVEAWSKVFNNFARMTNWLETRCFASFRSKLKPQFDDFAI